MLNLKTVARIALLAAVIIAAQQLRFQYVTGSIVNLALALSAAVTGLPGAALLSFISPALAIVQGLMPLAVMYPFIAAGNFVYCLMFILFSKRMLLALLLGIVLKPLIIAAGFYFAAGLPLPGVYAAWAAQFFTALVGGLVFVGIIKPLAGRLGRA
ncbi:MAG TPA: hypothetical protein PKO38_07390 [Bacillota bacterium]|nr:hypothetical protein [Bacillota bacterium]HOB87496.1 hypothetical protein [Bacillota bacterium]HOP68950.1 hypothetical protein [Bacillota bacterium]HPT33902.1 hypothetical protein [Bacillota bacterium]HPZ65157.1 hypothetical protein [Bacillota bacterium]